MSDQQEKTQSEEKQPRVETEESELTDEELDAVAGGATGSLIWISSGAAAGGPGESYIEEDPIRRPL